ncbi:Glutathione S-transferase, domain-containing protein [Cladophialophora immunda]|nr:Glutathione S-transferase, domain-containing protein [Cladophialophora immunda]
MSRQAQNPDITLFFLGASRAIRIAWLLEELNLPYQLVSSPRASNGLAPEEFKAQIPTRMGKSPVVTDGDLVVQESAAIAEYLCETYDPQGRLLPKERRARAKVREWMAAAEGTFMIHALAILYARWRLPKPASKYLPEMEKGLAPNVHNALNWLESELADGRRYLVSREGEGEGEAAASGGDDECAGERDGKGRRGVAHDASQQRTS